jgi:hypothetical protein
MREIAGGQDKIPGWNLARHATWSRALWAGLASQAAPSPPIPPLPAPTPPLPLPPRPPHLEPKLLRLVDQARRDSEGLVVGEQADQVHGVQMAAAQAPRGVGHSPERLQHLARASERERGRQVSHT